MNKRRPHLTDRVLRGLLTATHADFRYLSAKRRADVLAARNWVMNTMEFRAIRSKERGPKE